MSAAFKEVMKQLAVIGQDTTKLIDCSEVIPVPKPAVGAALYASTAQLLYCFSLITLIP
jgi:hypothetical protein